jgi:hypothetical protein
MGNMKEAVERVLRTLHEDPGRYRPTPRKARAVAQRVAPGEDPRALAKEALRELRRRVREAVEGLWEALGVEAPPPSELEEALERGDSVRAWFPESLPGRVALELGGKTSAHFPSPLARSLAGLKTDLVGSKGGDVGFDVLRHVLSARRGRAFFRGENLERVRGAREVVRAFRPLFRAFGLEDLEGALEVLADLKDEEAKTEGPYALARRGESRVLVRGKPFGGPPALGAALFLGEEAVFRYPEGLEIGLKVDPVTLAAVLVEMRVRWEGETAKRSGALAYATPTERDLLGVLVRKGLEGWLRDPFLVPESPKMRALLEELAESEDPIAAPKDPRFLRRARLRALANL